MTADFLSQHSNWIGTFLIAIVVPLALGGATLGVFWLDAREKGSI
jgi:multidrug efflux pump subunit AcrB